MQYARSGPTWFFRALQISFSLPGVLESASIMLESPADIIKGIVKDFESPSVSTPGASDMGGMQKGGQGREVLAKADITVLELP